MINIDNVTQSIYRAIDEINGQLPKSDKLEKAPGTALFGNNGRLDSLGLVSLITSVEQYIEEDFGMSVTLLEEFETLENENPFETVNTLADYIVSALEQKTNG